MKTQSLDTVELAALGQTRSGFVVCARLAAGVELVRLEVVAQVIFGVLAIGV